MKLKLLKKEQEKVDENIDEFVRKNSKTFHYQCYLSDRKRKLFCPCCNYYAYYIFNSDPKDDYRFTRKSYANYRNWCCFILHLIAKIRLSGDIPHIELFIKIFGKKVAKRALMEYAEKSAIVYRNLNLVLRSL